MVYREDPSKKDDIELQQFRTIVSSHEQTPNVSS